jgi:DNA (cytosine-5)-methyltransferase 1
MKVLDLFSGIGGNTLALQGFTHTVAYCEFDKHAQAVLKSRMADGSIPTAPIFPDVTTLKGDDVGEIDMIVGGFPCQDISVAGKGAGIAEGTRSGLFFQIMRLTDEIKPRLLFLENVPAIRTKGLDIVLRELTKRGYDCRWTMLSAASVGARHKRERWFMLANRRGANGANTEYTGRYGTEILGGNTASVCRSKERPNSASEFEGVDTLGDVADSNKRGLPPPWSEQQTTGIAGENLAVPDSNSTRLQSSSTPRHTSGEGAHSVQQPTEYCEGDSGGPIKPELGGVVNGISEGLVNGLPDYLGENYWKEEPCERVTQEREQRVERIKRLGNAVVPLQARTAFIKLFNNVL